MNRWGWPVVLCWALLPAASLRAEEVGVLILAHGGSGRWNQAVQQTVAEAQLTYPTQITFGMGMHPQEVQDLQRAVQALEQQGVSRLVVVPLLISSASEVMRQFQYLLGLRDHGPWEAQVKPIERHVPVVMTGPLDDDPVVAEVLLERASNLSQTPAEESIVLVAHGPNSDEDNLQWLAVMDRLARRVKELGHFRAVIPVTMRDDAPKPVQEEATRRMRELIRLQSERGRTLVVPLLLANGGVETKIPERLEGLRYVYQGQALLPHPKLAQWIANRVRAAADSPRDQEVPPKAGRNGAGARRVSMDAMGVNPW